MKPLVFDATPLVYPGKINLIEKIRHLPEATELYGEIIKALN